VNSPAKLAATKLLVMAKAASAVSELRRVFRILARAIERAATPKSVAIVTKAMRAKLFMAGLPEVFLDLMGRESSGDRLNPI
jgi:hypothetical protein